MIINLDIQIEYMDLSYIEKLYVARLDAETQLFIPQRLNQTVDQTVYPVDLKTITLRNETLAGEVMRVVYEEQYKVLSCYATDTQGKEIKDRKSTRLNPSHMATSYVVFCLTKQMPYA